MDGDNTDDLTRWIRQSREGNPDASDKFARMTVSEIADALDLSPSTVKRRLRFAKA